MHFAYAPSGWPAFVLIVLLLAGVGTLAFLEYRRPLSPLAPGRRATLVALRALTLAALVAFLFRPTIVAPSPTGRDAVVPIVVDVSRSMRLPGSGGASRISQAVALLRTQLVPVLSGRFSVELYGAGDRLAPATIDALKADASRSDLGGSLRALRDRSRGRQIAGIVVVSDGGDTESADVDPTTTVAGGPPILAVGVGLADGLHDREVAGLTAGEQHLDQASVDLHVTVRSSGFGRMPFELRVLANGRSVETRRIVPEGEGLPIEETFTVLPESGVADGVPRRGPRRGGRCGPGEQRQNSPCQSDWPETPTPDD